MGRETVLPILAGNGMRVKFFFVLRGNLQGKGKMSTVQVLLSSVQAEIILTTKKPLLSVTQLECLVRYCTVQCIMYIKNRRQTCRKFCVWPEL